MTFLDQINGLLGIATRLLGEPVVYSATGETDVTVYAVFDGIYEEVDPNTGAVIVSTKPSIGVRDADLPRAPKNNDRVTVRGAIHRVVEVQTDGQGGSKLLLHKV